MGGHLGILTILVKNIDHKWYGTINSSSQIKYDTVRPVDYVIVGLSILLVGCSGPTLFERTDTHGSQ